MKTNEAQTETKPSIETLALRALFFQGKAISAKYQARRARQVAAQERVNAFFEALDDAAGGRK